MMVTGDQIKAAREARGLTQAAFAEALGLTDSTVRKIERGERVAPPTLRAAIDFLGLDDRPVQQIIEARKAQHLSKAALSKATGISQNTLGRLERGIPVQQATVRKVREALGIGTQQPQFEPRFPADVELVRDMVAAWLMEIPPAQRGAATLDLFQRLEGQD